jgi:hypothetical protein
MSELQGLADVTRRLNKAVLKAGKAAEGGVRLAALDLQRRSALLAPHETGDLEGSLQERAEVVYERGFPTTSVGSALPYALIQHEDLSFNHEPGKQAKYLEQPYRENVDRYIRLIARSVKEGLR